MTAHALSIAEWGTFDIYHILGGGKHSLATMGHNSDILRSLQSLVVSLVSYGMKPGGRAPERREIVAAKAGNNIRVVVVVDEIDWRDA
jgi:hypothetical protein